MKAIGKELQISRKFHRLKVPYHGFASTRTALCNTIKSLGVTFNSPLKFDQHVRNACKSAYFHVFLRIFQQLRGALENTTANEAACAIANYYCNILPADMSETNLNKAPFIRVSRGRGYLEGVSVVQNYRRIVRCGTCDIDLSHPVLKCQR